MLTSDMEKLYPSAKTLVKECVASRVLAKDASLYDFSDGARETAENFMGWVDLGMRPQCDLAKVQRFADDVVASGIKTVVLIGQGGSTQAPMTITKYNKSDTVRANRVSFKTLDSDSPVRMRELLADCDPATTLVIVSSKSGGTIEPRLLSSALRDAFEAQAPEINFANHLVVITDPGSQLERQAHEEGWLAVFNGEAHRRRAFLCAVDLRPSACGACRHRPGAVHRPREGRRRALQRGLHRQPGDQPRRVPLRQLPQGAQQVLVPHAEARARLGPLD